MSDVAFGDPRLPPRFWSKVRVDESGCWIWTAHVDRGGYGQFRGTGAVCRAHVLPISLKHPKPDPSMTASHLCHVRECVNPAHLAWESMRDNVKRSKDLITHCPKRHEYTNANTGIHLRGWRYCRTCHRANAKVRREWRQLQTRSTDSQQQSPSE